VRQLSDAAVQRLRDLPAAPDLTNTRYELAGELGRGGMGVVYRVRDRELDRDVALKVIADDQLDRDAGVRLIREARAIAALEHPGIVPVHDVGTLPDGRLYYTMKLVRGARLDRRLAEGVSSGEALRWFERICDAVSFAHAAGVIHRDLKPQNVMIGPYGEVLVLDWGVAKLKGSTDRASGARRTEPTGTDPGVALGTPGYMAPEQAAGTPVDERADVFALGVMLREMLEAAPAGGALPLPLRSIVGCATSHDPTARYATVSALGADVASFLDRRPVAAHRETIAERLARLASRHRFALGLIGVYIIARLVLFLVLGR
jgi:eukaryotic-like serine/threonine-protein kinase